MYKTYHDKCKGGYAIKEIRTDDESKVFCYGIIDLQNDEPIEECLACPKHVSKIDDWFEEGKSNEK